MEHILLTVALKNFLNLGLAGEVRQWLAETRDKPRLGKALSLQLEAKGPQAESLLREFLVSEPSRSERRGRLPPETVP